MEQLEQCELAPLASSRGSLPSPSPRTSLTRSAPLRFPFCALGEGQAMVAGGGGGLGGCPPAHDHPH